ncbi:hypothetical protein GY26_04305 [Gammaproteobacteria bacterium MFB021]|nr:hypothetical protein GY26_04305 [Gammaproteobacteria bacterium MFB021]
MSILLSRQALSIRIGSIVAQVEPAASSIGRAGGSEDVGDSESITLAMRGRRSGRGLRANEDIMRCLARAVAGVM